MQEVFPFSDRFEMQQAIDNGGRFYNIFSRAGDSVVTKGELAKAAGVCGADERAVLFLELAKWDLDAYDQNWIVDLLEPKLRDRYESRKPARLKPSGVEKRVEIGSAAIVEGYPCHLDDETKCTGFVTIPIMVGNVTTFSMVPMDQNFALYELFDETGMNSASCLIAIPKGKSLPEGNPIRLGGLLRDVQAQDEPPTHPLYPEAHYFTVLS